MTIVNLPTRVSGDSLEQACKAAAKQLGYRARVHDNFKERYELRDTRLEREYEGTDIRVGNLLPALEVSWITRGKEQGFFFITTRLAFAFASKKKVAEYLTAVENHLYQSGPRAEAPMQNESPL
jgi:hypothetical protein